MYVLATDIENNYIFVGRGDDHPGLLRQALFIAADEVHWIRPDRALNVGESCDYQVRIRYRQPLQKACLYAHEEGLYISFEEPQKSITAGQFAAWYDGDELVGSGVISE